MNDVMRRLLWLPDQASTFAPKVDNLHYFVITVTMIASVLTGVLAFYFFFKYRARRQNQSTPLVLPSVKFEIAVIGVPLFFFLLWFVQGFKDYIWYTTPPRNTMDVYVMGKKWMWKFAYAGGGPNAGCDSGQDGRRLRCPERRIGRSARAPEPGYRSSMSPRDAARETAWTRLRTASFR